MTTSPRRWVSRGFCLAWLPVLLSCGSGGDTADVPPAPQPVDVGGAGLFAQERVLRNEGSLLASMPSRPGVAYAWTVENGSASATIVAGAGSNVVRIATGGHVGSFVLKATATAADGSATVSSRTVNVVGDWLLDGTNPLPRQDHSATLLLDGRVLVAGGMMGFGSGEPNPTAQIYDPETNTWGSAPPIPTPRALYSATRLANGQVLVAGGVGSAPSAAVEIYDPVAGWWRAAAPMPTTRHSHTATLLSDGRVLVAGGTNAANIGGGPLAEAVIYDPATDRWAAAGRLTNTRDRHTAVRLADGRVLVAGGMDDSRRPGVLLASAELFDPATNTWTPTGDLAVARWYHAAALLGDGRVVVAGGGAENWAMPALAEVYDPATGRWTAAGNLVAARYRHTLSVLPDGRLFAAGGNFTPSLDGQPGAEAYDPALNRWSAVGRMAEGRSQHSATVLADGAVLVVGGVRDAGPLASAERYDPRSDTWTSAGRGHTLIARNHTATLLQDGSVLQAGGEAGSPLPQTARFDPVTNTWQDTGPLIGARFAHTATLLGTGEVLVTGGQTSRLVTDPRLQTAELYDPAARQWRATAQMGQRRTWHTATAIGGGRVLVVGGEEDQNRMLATAELYDRGAEAWTPVTAMSEARHRHTATLLRDGTVLVAGGSYFDTFASTEIYDPAANSWRRGPDMNGRRRWHTATLLPDGKVLVVGGYGPDSVPVTTAELYDPATGRWSSTGSMSVGRVAHTATLLPDGTVMVTGGLDVNFSQPPLASTEIYDPATGIWTRRGDLNFARVNHTATLLGDGRVVLLGGGGRFHVAGGAEFWR